MLESESHNSTKIDIDENVSSVCTKIAKRLQMYFYARSFSVRLNIFSMFHPCLTKQPFNYNGRKYSISIQ